MDLKPTEANVCLVFFLRVVCCFHRSVINLCLAFLPRYRTFWEAFILFPNSCVSYTVVVTWFCPWNYFYNSVLYYNICLFTKWKVSGQPARLSKKNSSQMRVFYCKPFKLSVYLNKYFYHLWRPSCAVNRMYFSYIFTISLMYNNGKTKAILKKFVRQWLSVFGLRISTNQIAGKAMVEVTIAFTDY